MLKVISGDLRITGRPTAERVKWIRENYYRDGRLYSDTPRDQWWMIGKLFKLIAPNNRWAEVRYDVDGIEVDSITPDGYREWLRALRAAQA